MANDTRETIEDFDAQSTFDDLYDRHQAGEFDEATMRRKWSEATGIKLVEQGVSQAAIENA